jgi:hypothetical protein
MVRPRKPLNTSPLSLTGRSTANSAMAQRRVARRISIPKSGRGTARVFFEPNPKFALEGDRTRDLEVLFGSLNH